MLRRLHWPVIFFAIVPIASLIVIWPYTPSPAARLALLVAGVLMVFMVWLKKIDLPLVGAVLFSLVLANFSYIKLSSPLLASIIVFGSINVIGLTAGLIDQQSLNRQTLVNWFLISLATTEVSSVVVFWPFSFFNRALITFLFFYALWYYLKIKEGGSNQSVLAHFIFVSLAVILVLGTLIWANFPHLRLF
jgi:hypothetical protein